MVTHSNKLILQSGFGFFDIHWPRWRSPVAGIHQMFESPFHFVPHVHMPSEQQTEQGTRIGCSSRKRKYASDARRMAMELSKIFPSHEIPRRFRIDRDRLLFSETTSRFPHDQCNWAESKETPLYCAKAQLAVEAYLPGRKYLTRYIVRCAHCYENEDPCFHLYCSYCDEVLTGSIARPSGKISDHLVTTRHIYQQALAIKDSLERGDAGLSTFATARHYVMKLEEWSESVRYTTQASVKQVHFDKILQELYQLVQTPQAAMVSSKCTNARGSWPWLRARSLVPILSWLRPPARRQVASPLWPHSFASHHYPAQLSYDSSPGAGPHPSPVCLPAQPSINSINASAQNYRQ